MDSELERRLLDSIEANRLVVFCGAGLSMAAPSKVPSAKALAIECATQYEVKHGYRFSDDVKEDLEAIAEFFSAKNELHSIFINRLLPVQSFIRSPNRGHIAVGDFLISGVIEFLVSTNVDYLIEGAVQALGESHVPGDIDGDEANVSKDRKPHLKIHGCLTRDPKNTVWCKTQLQTGVLKSRHEQFRTWLAANLRERDLLFVGFWSDWSYLNDIFQDALGGIDHGLVVIANLSDETALRSKAPKLWEWSGSERVQRFIVNQSAHTFLDELRGLVWRAFLERLHRESLSTYVAVTGNERTTPPSIPPGLSADDLANLRLDTCGIPKGQPARNKRPDTSMRVLGAVQIGLLSSGADIQGSHYILNDQRVRVINGQGRVLSDVQKSYQDEPADVLMPDTTICVGAKDVGGAPPDVIRGVPITSTIIRPNATVNWLTEDATKHLWGQNVLTSRG